MTREESRETLLCLYDAVDEEGIIDTHTWYKGIQDNIREALDMAIKTLCKYQKIEQILKDIPYGGDATVRRIQEVIEDGSTN